MGGGIVPRVSKLPLLCTSKYIGSNDGLDQEGDVNSRGGLGRGM